MRQPQLSSAIDQATRAEADEISIASVIARRAITMVFQPIVDLTTEQIVAYEALVRGPADTVLSRPDQLFAAAHAAGLVGELDNLCRAQAVMQADASPARDQFVLFVNGEPAHLQPDDTLAPFLSPQHPAMRAGRTVLELSERSIFAQPAELLQSVNHARRLGWRIAVDDLGASRESLGLIGLIDPDIIKLDLSIIQGRPDRQTGSTLNCVSHQLQSKGCLIVAEGIETDEHLTRARSIGAHLGQGWLFGRPEALPITPPGFGVWPTAASTRPLTVRPRLATGPSPTEATSRPDTTFQLVQDHPRLRRVTKDILYAISLDLEAQALAQTDGAIVFGCFQQGRHLTDATRRRYSRLAESCALVAAIGCDIESNPAPGVRGVAIEPDDSLADEWSVVILSSHLAVALLARDVGDTDDTDRDRRFDYLVTYDRDLVREAAQILLRRIIPENPMAPGSPQPRNAEPLAING